MLSHWHRLKHKAEQDLPLRYSSGACPSLVRIVEVEHQTLLSSIKAQYSWLFNQDPHWSAQVHCKPATYITDLIKLIKIKLFCADVCIIFYFREFFCSLHLITACCLLSRPSSQCNETIQQMDNEESCGETFKNCWGNGEEKNIWVFPECIHWTQRIR